MNSGDQEAYNSARANLEAAKHTYTGSSPWRMWQGIQAITAFKPPRTVPPSSSASLPDELNYFHACFDWTNKEVTLKVHLPPGELPLSLSTYDVCTTLSPTVSDFILN